jgi:predicted patatin/cPLA2 family phospholipase
MVQNVLILMNALLATSTVPLKANVITLKDHINVDVSMVISNQNLVSVKMSTNAKAKKSIVIKEPSVSTQMEVTCANAQAV